MVGPAVNGPADLDFSLVASRERGEENPPSLQEAIIMAIFFLQPQHDLFSAVSLSPLPVLR